MRHHDCGPGCDREFEDQLVRVHPWAIDDLTAYQALTRDLSARLDTGAGLRAALDGAQPAPARAD